jgi:aminodeoxyfutalosine deaminase
MRYLKADKIFNGEYFLQNDAVLVLNEQGILSDISSIQKIPTENIETFEGIICPGFINTHCHLELSHMKGLIPEKTGLVEFAKGIITKRNSVSEEEQIEKMKEADKDMKAFGIAAVGDISNSLISADIKEKSDLYYHTFIELIGLNPARWEDIFKQGITLLNELKQKHLPGSIAPHAPYSTSTELIKAIAAFDEKNHLPFSIHNQESAEEDAFMRGETSAFQDLYTFLKLDIPWFKPRHHNSLASYIQLLKGKRQILVHNTFSNYHDAAFANETVFPCLCPTANLYIEDTLPDFKEIAHYSHNLCFGTDSLASNDTLDVLKEASFFYNHTHQLELTLKALTSNGARALGIENQYGHLIPGKAIGLNLIEAGKHELLLKAIISPARKS